ncbi:MAG: LytR C-terminal domain-containing protein [Lachnospiraceae bacterium]|nr:LytR C-terminal domain-containing protein [Lachnospiraceae bacterium]
MDKKTMLRVFGEAFLRSMVVLMAIAIIGFAAFFIIKVNSDKKVLAENEAKLNTTEYSEDQLHDMLEKENAKDTEASEEKVTTEEVTTEATTEVQKIPSTDKNILLLNSTSVAGLASAWNKKINGAGFANTAIGNYNSSGEVQTKIYVAEEGMGEDLLEYFNGATIIVGALETSQYTIISGSISTVDIYVVIGSDNSSVQ